MTFFTVKKIAKMKGVQHCLARMLRQIYEFFRDFFYKKPVKMKGVQHCLAEM